MIFYGSRFSDKVKIQLMFFLAACVVLILPFTAKFGTGSEEKFWVCFCVMFFYGPINGIMQGSVFGVASILPFEYVSGVMLGQGLSGITCTVIKLILILILPGLDNLFI